MTHEKPKNAIADWKHAFRKDENTIEAEIISKTELPSLTFIKKVPITFRLTRSENPKDFELMSFVIKACAKSSSDPVKTVLHVEQARTGSRLVACDGLRLHAAEISMKIKSGNYKPQTAKDVITLGEPVEGVTFPPWWPKAIPENAEKRGVINLENSGMGRGRKKNEKFSIALNDFAKQTGTAVNLRFLEDLPKREWVVYSHNDRQTKIVLKLKSGNAREPDEKSPVAVILPIVKAA